MQRIAADAFTLGAPVYWDADDELATSIATDNTKLGVAVEAAPADTGSLKVRLSGF
ncbi:DUF2190 family protein [Thioclava litoralis]|uniref:DUF2190 family protein n=1 Tax=Thioclava litoralis TaxID=3076557 RepID=A0ABZ1E0Q3_9RHOB|nr:DUF2190 family protein [Thioclava sp. FTW29]